MKELKYDYWEIDLGNQLSSGNTKLIPCEDIKKIKEIIKTQIEYSEMPCDWVRVSSTYNNKDIKKIKEISTEIRKNSQLFMVVGIGGSFLGSKAVIDCLELSDKDISVKYAGFNLESRYINELIKEMKQKETSLCIISKSGKTMETNLVYNILKNVMKEKYSDEELKSRIYVITEFNGSELEKESRSEGYKIFPMPKKIGGRYSVFTWAGLLPMSVAGVDIEQLISGAHDMQKECIKNDDEFCEALLQYCWIRYKLEMQGKKVELFEFYDSRMSFLIEWCKQLYGESHGKEGKGIYPSSIQMPRDLHSIGQFLQEGSQNFFETIISVENDGEALFLGDSNILEGKNICLKEVEDAIKRGVVKAHRNIDIPIIEIKIPKLDEYYLGKLLYFMMINCSVGGFLLEINPFNQEGVEKYKIEVKKNLNFL